MDNTPLNDVTDMTAINALPGYDEWCDEVDAARQMELDLQGQDEEDFAAYCLSPRGNIPFDAAEDGVVDADPIKDTLAE